MAKGDLALKTPKQGDLSLKGGQKQNTAPDNSGGAPSYGGGSGYRKSGGGGGGASSKYAQKQKQAQLNNTGGNYQQRAKDLAGNTKGRAKEIADTAKGRLGEMDKNAQAQLNNIQQSMDANIAAYNENRRNIMQNVQWQPNQQKEQSMLMSLRNRMGNAAYGSGIQDLAEGLQRVDDMNDTELINTWKQNENAAYSNWYQANEALVNDYNDQVTAINEQLSQFNADYSDQMSKLKYDYNDELSKLQSQYWSTMSNIDPELATKKNLQTAAKNVSGTSKTAKAVTKAEKKLETAKSAQKIANKLGKKNKEVDTSKLAKGTAAQRKAAEVLVDAMHYVAEKKQGESIAKATKKGAENLVKQAKKEVTKAKNANRVSIGEGDEQYYLPNVNLSKPINFDKYSTLPGQSAALQALMKTRESAPATNPYTSSYIRPAGGSATGGTIDTSRAANTGFSDNLAAFRRV